MPAELLRTGPSNAKHRVVLAHGAGAGMRSVFMETVARGLAGRGIETVRFEFPYMEQRSGTAGKRGGPDRGDVLVATWKEVVARLGGGSGLVIGGKSMGGRIATMVSDDLGAMGVVCFGYPFHPTGKPKVLRTAHLAKLRTPTLIVQGTRDSMGTREEVEGYALSESIRVLWIEGGDHSLRPARGAGLSATEALELAIEAAAGLVAAR